MKEIEYDLNFLSLIKNLSKISESIVIHRDDDKLIIRRRAKNNSMVFLLEAQASKFNMEDDDITIENFLEFYDMISVLKSPKIKRDQNKVIIEKADTKINYILGSLETVLKDVDPIEFGDSEISMVFNKEDIKDIIKYISLVKGEYIKIQVGGENITFNIFNQTFNNSVDRVFSIKNDGDHSFNYTITTDFFTNIPIENYVLNMKKDGFLKWDLISDDYKLEIITSEIED
jgi:hypothetical protein